MRFYTGQPSSFHVNKWSDGRLLNCDVLSSRYLRRRKKAVELRARSCVTAVR